MPQQVTNNYYNVDPKTGKINAGPYTGLTLQEAKELNQLQHKDYNKQLQQRDDKKFADDLRAGAGKMAGQIFPLIGAGLATPLIGASTVLSPFWGGVAGGMALNHVTDDIVRNHSDYNSWADMVSDKTGMNKVLSEFTNPGGFISGGVGNFAISQLGKKAFPKVVTDTSGKIKDYVKSFEVLPKTKPTAHYRNIGGKEGYVDVITKREIAPKTPQQNTEGSISLSRGYSRAFWGHPGKLPNSKVYRGPYAVEADIPMKNGFGGHWGYAPDPKTSGFTNVPLDLPEVRLLKQYRFPNTEKVLFQRELSKQVSPKTVSPEVIKYHNDLIRSLENNMNYWKGRQTDYNSDFKMLLDAYRNKHISPDEYTELLNVYQPLSPDVQSYAFKRKLERELINKKLLDQPNRNILVSTKQLGENISKGGINNKGVFKIGDNLVAKARPADTYYPSDLNVLYSDKLTSPRIPKTLQVKDIDGIRYEVKQMAPGKTIEDLSNTEIKTILPKHRKNFLKDFNEVNKAGFVIDPNGGNIIYDPKVGFSFIDLTPRSKDFGKNINTLSDLTNQFPFLIK